MKSDPRWRIHGQLQLRSRRDPTQVRPLQTTFSISELNGRWCPEQDVCKNQHSLAIIAGDCREYVEERARGYAKGRPTITGNKFMLTLTRRCCGEPRFNGIPDRQIEAEFVDAKTIRVFQGKPHRVEYVRTLGSNGIVSTNGTVGDSELRTRKSLSSDHPTVLAAQE